MKVVIVGAGLAGLSAAYDLVRANADVTVLESERRAGGIVVTDRPAPGWVVEGGPESFVATEPEIPALARELGIAERLVSQRVQESLLWDGRRLATLSEGDAARLLGIDTTHTDLSRGFQSFQTGMAEITESLFALTGRVTRFTVGVTGMQPRGKSFRLSATGGMSLDCDALILTLPAHVAARLFAALVPEVRDVLEEVRYYPSTTISLAYRRDQIRTPLEASGFVVTPSAESALRAGTYSSVKFAGRAPEGFVLLRAFLAPVSENAPAVAHREMAKILGITGEPLWHRLFEWPRGLPRYGAGHAAALAAARERLARIGPVFLAGAGYDGAGVSACVRSGRAAARAVLELSPAAASPAGPRAPR
jgi:protoporphyrinogen oxidase